MITLIVAVLNLVVIPLTGESLGQVAPYDLALVKLVHPINLHEDINVVCLPQSNSIFRSGARCVVTGWGKTESGRGK